MQVLPALAQSNVLNLSGSASSAAGAAAATSATSSAAAGSTASAAAPLTTIAQHFRSVSATEGIRSLWRGVASVIMGAGPAHAAHFGMYEFVREISGGRGEGWSGVLGTAVAGASATITSDALMNPFDGTSITPCRRIGRCRANLDVSIVIKQRMQIRGSPHRTVVECAKSVYKAEGLTAFYVSYPTTLTMTVPFTAVQFSVYESLKGVMNPDGSYSPMTHIVAGGLAGGVAAAVTTPLDVAKVCPAVSRVSTQFDD